MQVCIHMHNLFFFIRSYIELHKGFGCSRLPRGIHMIVHADQRQAKYLTLVHWQSAWSGPNFICSQSGPVRLVQSENYTLPVKYIWVWGLLLYNVECI